jgi:hypothetical protein
MSRRHDHRLSALRALVAGVLATGAILCAWAGEARAFCRTTVCDPAIYQCAFDDDGCTRTGPALSWRRLPLTYRFDGGGSQELDMDRVREATRRAFQTWSNVTCGSKRTSLRFEEGDDIPRTQPRGTEVLAPAPFGIYFRDQVWPYEDGNEELAHTTQRYDPSGWINSSVIEVNTFGNVFRLDDTDPQPIDLQAVLTHEIGHYIGLAHSQVAGSIMAPRYCQSADRCGPSADQARALAEDDVDAVCALFPPGGITGVAYEAPSASSCAVSARLAPRDRDAAPASPIVPLATLAGLAALVVARSRRAAW